MIEIVKNYLVLKKHIPILIEKSMYSVEFISSKIDMKLNNFIIKKQKGKWSSEEIFKIVKLIENEELENYFDTILAKNSFAGKKIKSEEFEKMMGW